MGYGGWWMPVDNAWDLLVPPKAGCAWSSLMCKRGSRYCRSDFLRVHWEMQGRGRGNKLCMS